MELIKRFLKLKLTLSLIIVIISIANLLHLLFCIQFLGTVFLKEASGSDRTTVSGYVSIRILTQPIVSLLLFLVNRGDYEITNTVAVQLWLCCFSFLL